MQSKKAACVAGLAVAGCGLGLAFNGGLGAGPRLRPCRPSPYHLPVSLASSRPDAVSYTFRGVRRRHAASLHQQLCDDSAIRPAAHTVLQPSHEQTPDHRRRAMIRRLVRVAVLLLPLALIVSGMGSQAFAAARRAVVDVAPSSSSLSASDNRVKALLKPAVDQITGLFSGFKGSIDGKVGKVGQSWESAFGKPLWTRVQCAWRLPLARYMTPPAPGTFRGDLLQSIVTRVPSHWTALDLLVVLSALPLFEARVAVPLGVALGLPWLKALTYGCAANALAMPAAYIMGSLVGAAGSIDRVAEALATSRDKYQGPARDFAKLLGRLSVKKTVLEAEEKELRAKLEQATSVLQSGDVVMTMDARKRMVELLTSATAALDDLSAEAKKQQRAKLDALAFKTTVGEALGDEEAFKEITVAELGQRRLEIAWHPDVTLFPALGQTQAVYHVEEVLAQAEYDFVQRPQTIKDLRMEVRDLERMVEESQKLPTYATRAAKESTELISMAYEARESEAGEGGKRRRREQLDEATRRKLEDEEEERRVADLRTKGQLMLNFGWPRAIMYVGIPLPFSGAWTALYWAGVLKMRMLPTMCGTLLGIVLSALVGLLVSLNGWFGILVYLSFISALYGGSNPVVELRQFINQTREERGQGNAWGKGEKGKGAK